jgi:micrococcal nuclease
LLALVVAAAGLLLVFGVGCASIATSSQAAGGARHALPRRSRVVVDHVVDGDTLDVRLDGRLARVRTVQIDAPESSSTRYGRPDRCGLPAKRFADSLTAPGRIVTLQFAGEDRTDAYGRLLAIVHLGGAEAITWQERMVRSGWAKVLVYHGNTTPLLPALWVDAAYAKAHRLGVWAVCGGHFHDPGDHER